MLFMTINFIKFSICVIHLAPTSSWLLINTIFFPILKILVTQRVDSNFLDRSHDEKLILFIGKEIKYQDRIYLGNNLIIFQQSRYDR